MKSFEIILTSPVEWVAAQLQALPQRPLRRAVVLVAAERQAHAIRRRICVDRGRPQDLAGVHLLRPAEFARELLAHAGYARGFGWEDVRRLRLLRLFESRALAGSLRYFNADQLRSGQGYVDAFARTIADLEAGGVDAALATAIAERLAVDDEKAAERFHDVTITWAAADADRANVTTAEQVLVEAASVVGGRPELATDYGPTFAVLAASPSTALLRFLRALPACRIIFQEARPQRTDTQRWRRLVAATLRVEPTPPPDSVEATGRTRTSELEIVQRFLFALPELLTHPHRLRSTGIDGSVDLEEYPGIEDEVEAAAVWVTEQIAAGTPLEQLALVVPEVDPYAPLLVDRLARLARRGSAEPIRAYVAGGLRLAASPAGTRLLSVLQALVRGLEAEATIRVLPALRRGEGDDGERRVRLSPSRAAEIVYGAGIVGGSPGDAAGLTEWLPRLLRQRDALRMLVDRADPAGSENGGHSGVLDVRDRGAAERWLRDVEPILPGIAQLQELAAAVLATASLPVIWQQFRAFCERRLRMPPEPSNILALIEQRLQPVMANAAGQEVTGFSAVHFVMELVRRERRPTARFGEPCVFVGTASQASGLSFAAVRVLGLAEGALPHTPHDDPIVPDGLRRQVEHAAHELRAESDVVVPWLADRVLDDIHDVFRVISGVQQRVAFSAPRQWVDRSEREVSGIMLEVATALGRGGNLRAEGDVPTAARLRAVYLNPGREARLRYARRHPLSPRALLGTVPLAAGESAIAVPVRWIDPGPLALDGLWERLVAADEPALAAMDGIVTETWQGMPPAGLGPQRPISASALILLLRCPHQFLLERVLHLAQPAAAPSTDVIDPAVYGSLFHSAAERFYQECGPALCRHDGSLDAYLARARGIAEETFDALRHEYPMRGADGIARERSRLSRQIEHLVRYEWQQPAREFLHSEFTFGEPEAVRLDLEGNELFVRGKIDRIDRLDGRALAVRDLKTGRVRDFAEEPINAGRDLQIGLYVVALEASGFGGAPVAVAGYVHPSAAREPDRTFEGSNMEVLRRYTRQWLMLARQLLSAGLFPRTPNADDCRYCPFSPACGEGAAQRAARKLDNLPPVHPLEPFARFKRRERERER